MMMCKGLQGEKIYKEKNLGMKFFLCFYTSDVWSPEDRERGLIRKNMQTDKVLDLIANTTPTVAQQAQIPTVAQQADMHNLRTTVERKPTKRFTPSTYNQQKTKRRTRMGVKKEKGAKLGKQKVKKKKKIKHKLWHIIKLWQYLHNFK